MNTPLSTDTSAPPRRLPLIYITGSGRSGSTLLSRILASANNVFYCGELYRLAYTLFARGGDCACGATPQDCTFWSSVLSKSGLDTLPSQNGFAWWQLQKKYGLTRRFHNLVQGKFDADKEFHNYAQWLYRLYVGIYQTLYAEHNCLPILIDSSKLPGYGYILARTLPVDIRFIHLTRNPEAVCRSWQNPPFDPRKEQHMAKQTPLLTSWRWLQRNKNSQYLSTLYPYQRVRYEDLVADPQAFIAALVSPSQGGVLSDMGISVRLENRQVHSTLDHTLDSDPKATQSKFGDGFVINLNKTPSPVVPPESAHLVKPPALTWRKHINAIQDACWDSVIHTLQMVLNYRQARSYGYY